jgi:hypothetical protein
MSVISDIQSRFVSGNSVAVERAHITSSELVAIIALVAVVREYVSVAPLRVGDRYEVESRMRTALERIAGDL